MKTAREKLRQVRQNKVETLSEIRKVLDQLEVEDISDEKRTELKETLKGLNSKRDQQNELEKNYEVLAEEEKRVDASPETEDREVSVSITREEGEDEKGRYRPFRSIGEQLLSIRAAANPSASVDERLTNINKRAAAGMSEGVGSDGGFLVQSDFSSELIKQAMETGLLASRVRKFPIGAGKNGLVMNGINETSRADGSRWGGVQVYWENEADEATAAKPKFRKLEFKLQKLIGLCYATDELLSDAAGLGSVISQAFAEEFGYQMDNSIFRGNGAGKPLGILNSASLVSVAKESGQAATTLVAMNIIKMYARATARSRQNLVWLINQDIEPQLHSLTIAGASTDIPMYLPADGLRGQQFNTLYGRPVIAIEQASTLGTVGDVVLADLGQYGWIDQGGMDAQTSIHVKFTSDQTAFRFVMRVDGKPLWHSALTPANGTNTQSPFVALATRA